MIAERRPELTVMSGIAIIFVLLIHACAYCLGYLYPDMGYAEADVFLRVLRNLVTPAVPMFLFASGFKYALHDSDTPYLKFLGKRLPRVLMSFFIINTIFWSIDSLIWMEHFDAALLLKTYISSWLGNTVAYPLWYIPMYCCVIILCPLVCRIIRKSWMRFLLYLIVGCAQRIVAASIPLLGKYPFLFVSYPLFFELGIIAYEYDFASKLRGRTWYSLIYVGFVVLLSVSAPQLSQAALIQYYLFCVLGTVAYFIICVFLNGDKVLFGLGTYSYPLFLLHEPVMGRLTDTLLRRVGTTTSVIYVVLWTICTLLLTILFMKALSFIKLDSILWKFSLKRKKDTKNLT